MHVQKTLPDLAITQKPQTTVLSVEASIRESWSKPVATSASVSAGNHGVVLHVIANSHTVIHALVMDQEKSVAMAKHTLRVASVSANAEQAGVALHVRCRLQTAALVHLMANHVDSMCKEDRS